MVDDFRGTVQHPGAHLVTSTAFNPSSLEFKDAKHDLRCNDGRKSKLEGMLRKERIKECYQLGLQVQDQNGRSVSDHDKRRLKKQASKMAMREDKRGAISLFERDSREHSRPASRGMRTARSALSNHKDVLKKYKKIKERRKSQPAPCVWMHESEGADHSRDVFREREREAGLRYDGKLEEKGRGCTQVQAGAMVRERLRSMLMNDMGAVRDVFTEFDKDNDGVLNQKEFHAALHALGLELNKSESVKFMQRFLCNNGDKKRQNIDFHDFFTKVVGLPHNLKEMKLSIGAPALKNQIPTEKSQMTREEASEFFLAQVRLQVLNQPHCLQRVFSVMDPDHSGSIDTEELREGLRKIGLWLKEDELRQLFMVYDEDQSGAIDYQEFIAEILGMPSAKAMKKKHAKNYDEDEGPPEEKVHGAKGTIRARELQCIIRQKLERAIADPAHLREIFSRFDRDGSGVLTYDDVGAACDSFGIIINQEDKSAIFAQLDPGQRGFLTYNDFINHVALVPHDIVDLPHPHAPEARCSTPQIVDEMRDRIKEKVMCKRKGIENLFLAFNQDKRKSISYGAFHKTLHKLGLPLQDHHISDLWKEWGGVAKGQLDLTNFVDTVLSFSLSGPTLSSVPMSGVPMGEPEPNPRAKGSPIFDGGQTTLKVGEPHFTINSTRSTSCRPTKTLTPFADTRRTRSAASHRRPSTAPQQQPERLPSAMSGRSVRSCATPAWSPKFPLSQKRGQSARNDRVRGGASVSRPVSQQAHRHPARATLMSAGASSVRSGAGEGILHWDSANKITA